MNKIDINTLILLILVFGIIGLIYFIFYMCKIYGFRAINENKYSEIKNDLENSLTHSENTKSRFEILTDLFKIKNKNYGSIKDIGDEKNIKFNCHKFIGNYRYIMINEQGKDYDKDIRVLNGIYNRIDDVDLSLECAEKMLGSIKSKHEVRKNKNVSLNTSHNSIVGMIKSSSFYIKPSDDSRLYEMRKKTISRLNNRNYYYKSQNNLLINDDKIYLIKKNNGKNNENNKTVNFKLQNFN